MGKTYYQQMIDEMHPRFKKEIAKLKKKNPILGRIEEDTRPLILCVNELDRRLRKLEEMCKEETSDR